MLVNGLIVSIKYHIGHQKYLITLHWSVLKVLLSSLFRCLPHTIGNLTWEMPNCSCILESVSKCAHNFNIWQEPCNMIVTQISCSISHLQGNMMWKKMHYVYLWFGIVVNLRYGWRIWHVFIFVPVFHVLNKV